MDCAKAKILCPRVFMPRICNSYAVESGVWFKARSIRDVWRISMHASIGTMYLGEFGPEYLAFWAVIPILRSVIRVGFRVGSWIDREHNLEFWIRTSSQDLESGFQAETWLAFTRACLQVAFALACLRLDICWLEQYYMWDNKLSRQDFEILSYASVNSIRQVSIPPGGSLILLITRIITDQIGRHSGGCHIMLLKSSIILFSATQKWTIMHLTMLDCRYCACYYAAKIYFPPLFYETIIIFIGY